MFLHSLSKQTTTTTKQRKSCWHGEATNPKGSSTKLNFKLEHFVFFLVFPKTFL